MTKRTCFVFIFFLVAGLFSANEPYYEKQNTPYKYNPPLVCEIEVPEGIVNGFYVPTHKEMVIVAPGNYQRQEEATTPILKNVRADAEISDEGVSEKEISKGETDKQKEISKGETDKQKEKAKVVVDTIPAEFNKQIDVAFSDVPLKVALGQLAMEYGLKFIVANDVSNAQITCFEKDSPLSVVLDDITTQVKATYSYKEGKIMVYVFGTKIFKLALPNISHYFSSSINTSGYAGFENNITGTDNSSSSSSSSNNSSEEAGPNAEVKIKVEETKIYDEIENNIKAIISESGKYGMNKNTGMITITDYAENLKEVEKFLEFVNKEFSRQVSLKVRVVEVELNDKSQTGINWDYLTRQVKASSGFSLVSTGNTLIFKSNESPNPGVDDEGVSFILNVLQEFGGINIISQPSLTVLNTQPASIQVGAIKSYISSVSQESTDIGILSGTGTSQIAEGLTLALINKINDDGKVYLSLMPTIKEVNSIRSIPVAGGGQIEAPDISIRALTTSVVAEAGDTIILGGLIKEEDTIKTQKTPVLGDIPFLKYLFSQKTKEKVRSELVIMLTVEGVENAI